MTLYEAVLICRGTTWTFRRAGWLREVAVFDHRHAFQRNHVFGDYDHSNLAVVRRCDDDAGGTIELHAFMPQAEDVLADDYEVVR